MSRGTQLTVRGITDATLAWLQATATGNHRSLDKQILAILDTHAQPDAGREYAQQQAERLQRALGALHRLPAFEAWSPASVAERAREPDALAVLRAFAGETLLPFAVADRVADVLTVSPEWLKFGTGAIYPVQYVRLDQGTVEDVAATLIGTDRPGQTVHFIRDDNAIGDLYLMRTWEGSPAFEFFSTPHRLSLEVGNGGFAALCRIFRLLRHLEHHHGHTNFSSHQVRHGQLDAFLMQNVGIVHPLSLVNGKGNDGWMDDVWDANMLEKRSHWKGQPELSRQVLEAIKNEDAKRSKTSPAKIP